MWTIVLILTLMMPAGVAAQTAPAGTPRPGLPPRDTPLSKPATGKIRGRVLAADTNAPLRRAQVTLLAGQLGVRRFTTTDADGRYEFADVAEGRYTVTAGKGGYVTLQYGQRRAFEPGRQVAVADGQDLTQVDIALPRGSVITGRITDEFGEPIAGAQVEVQRYQYTPGGQRRLTFAGAAAGSSRPTICGEFRAYGLMPGEYVDQRHRPPADGRPGTQRQRCDRGVRADLLPGHAESRGSRTADARPGAGDVDPADAAGRADGARSPERSLIPRDGRCARAGSWLAARRAMA